MKTRKTVIAVLTVTVLITAALIASCISPVDGLSVKPGTEDNFIIPEGKGIVKFKVSDEGARTIIPAGLPTAANMTYQVEFRPGSGASFYHPSAAGDGIAAGTPMTYVGLTGTPAAVKPGTYTVIITGYNTAGTIPLAGWNSPALTPVTITSGGTATITADLKVFTDGGNGTFNYSIGIPVSVGGFDIFEMVITKYGGGFVDTIGLTENATTTDTVSLAPGYYTVKVTVAEANYQTRESVTAVHIYPSLTSTLTLTVPALVKNKFQVIFNANTETFVTGVTTQNVNYGTAATNPGTPTATSGASFVGWYKETGGTTAWVYSDKVIADQTVYAKWVAAGTPGNAEFTITFTGTEQADISSGTGTISRGALDGNGIALNLTLAPHEDGAWDSITWTLDGITVNTATCSIVNGGIFLPLLSGTYFDVSVLAVKDGVPWSDIVRINVAD